MPYRQRSLHCKGSIHIVLNRYLRKHGGKLLAFRGYEEGLKLAQLFVHVHRLLRLSAEIMRTYTYTHLHASVPLLNLFPPQHSCIRKNAIRSQQNAQIPPAEAHFLSVPTPLTIRSECACAHPCVYDPTSCLSFSTPARLRLMPPHSEFAAA